MNDYVQLVSCYPGLSADDCKEAKHKKIPHLHPGIFQHIGKFGLNEEKESHSSLILKTGPFDTVDSAVIISSVCKTAQNETDKTLS